MLLYSFVMECTAQSLRENAWLVVCGFAVMTVFIAVGLVVTRFLEPQAGIKRGIFRYALSFPNTGGFGTPLVLAFFGTNGLYRYSLFLFSSVIIIYSWGIAQLQPAKGQEPVKKRLWRVINPAFLAVLLGILLDLSGAKTWMPVFVRSASRAWATAMWLSL